MISSDDVERGSSMLEEEVVIWNIYAVRKEKFLKFETMFIVFMSI